jgi:outer membrane receptor protein involved in Fe transport
MLGIALQDCRPVPAHELLCVSPACARSDGQAFETVGINLAVRNLDARHDGVELELTTRPVPALYLQASTTYLNSTVYNVARLYGEIMNRSLPQASRVTVETLARYTFKVAAGSLAVETNWKSASGHISTSSTRPRATRDPT